MHSLVNTNFNRTYNPNNGQNALSDIKRLLTSRDTTAQTKACGYLCEVIKRYEENTPQRVKMLEYLLNNDIIMFLCEAISNLDWSLFRSVLECLRLLWQSHLFFVEDHDAHATSAVLRALVHYTSSGHNTAVDLCLHFLCDLLTAVRENGGTAPLSCDSAFSIEQLLVSLNDLASRLAGRTGTLLAAALVLQAFVSYQPGSLKMRATTANVLAGTLDQWLPLLLGTLNHVFLIGDHVGSVGMFYVVICQLGIDVIRLSKIIKDSKNNNNFIQTIINDDQEVMNLIQSSKNIQMCVHKIILEIVIFTKNNHKQLQNEEYGIFLTFLHTFLTEHDDVEVLIEFSDVLFVNGYLALLPQVHIARDNVFIRKVSTVVLGEILSNLSQKYLCDDQDNKYNYYVKDIQMGLVELQNGLERPQTVGLQLQKCQSYCLLIYFYFYGLSSVNPQEAMAPLLPYLVQDILRLPKSFKSPNHITKTLWLVFSMSTISNASLTSFNDRIYLEKAIDRFIGMLLPNPTLFYTHHPAILLWAFTSQRISVSIRITILCQWLKLEDSLPNEIARQPSVWHLLLNILSQNLDETILTNTIKALKTCLEEMTDETRQEFATLLWSSLPGILSKVLIDFDSNTDTNARHVLELATILIPLEVDQTVCLKVAVLLSTIFSKVPTNPEQINENRFHLQYVCLKLCLYLLGLTSTQEDGRVLLKYMNRSGFLPSVLCSTNSVDDRVACAALQLLSCIIHYFTTSHSQPTTTLQVDTNTISRSLQRDSCNERGAALLQLVYMILNSGLRTPLVLSATGMSDLADQNQGYAALRVLMFRIQMVCCKESASQSSAGWKTLSAIFKYGIITENDSRLVAILTTQPWTHALIHFQLLQNITQEFLTFTNNWLVLLKIIIKKDMEQSRKKHLVIYKQSMTYKTLMLLKKNLSVYEGDSVPVRDTILGTAKELIDLEAI